MRTVLGPSIKNEMQLLHLKLHVLSVQNDSLASHMFTISEILRYIDCFILVPLLYLFDMYIDHVLYLIYVYVI